jgi:hypothetical protein
MLDWVRGQTGDLGFIAQVCHIRAPSAQEIDPPSLFFTNAGDRETQAGEVVLPPPLTHAFAACLCLFPLPAS